MPARINLNLFLRRYAPSVAGRRASPGVTPELFAWTTFGKWRIRKYKWLKGTIEDIHTSR
jgi:hypothetical protein